MQFNFYLRNLRIAPRKVRSVAALIKGVSAISAQNQLSFQVRRPAESLLKLLKSGVASADKNFNVKADHLYVRNILVDEGPMLKRFRPRAHGRAGAIHKKTSHITLVLESVGATAKTLKSGKKMKSVVKEAAKAVVSVGGEGKIKEEQKTSFETPKVIGPKSKTNIGFGRRIFRRKSV